MGDADADKFARPEWHTPPRPSTNVRAPEEVLLAVLGAHPSLTPSGHARRCACRGPLQVAAEEAPGLDSAPQLPWPGVGLNARKLQRRAGATEKK